jgi:hypothetical protein
MAIENHPKRNGVTDIIGNATREQAKLASFIANLNIPNHVGIQKDALEVLLGSSLVTRVTFPLVYCA